MTASPTQEKNDPISERISGLPQEKRKLLAQLLAEKRGGDRAPAKPKAAPANVETIQPETEDLALAVTGTADGVKASYRRFYDTVTKQLDSTMFGQFSFFLNYGYVPDHHPQFARLALPEHYINRNSVRLVLELVGDCPLTNARVLDVGCGRGGTVHVIKTMFDAAAITGLDLSPQAVAFCRQAHADARVRFLEGDAEKLPFPDGAFDIVTNVESSHSYPDIHAFYTSVYRVLSPGGSFLYTDVFPHEQMGKHIGFLNRLGFALERDTDITSNVLLSCDEIAQTRVQAFNASNDPGLMQNFLATPGSDVYKEMQSGRWSYRILRFKKPS